MKTFEEIFWIIFDWNGTLLNDKPLVVGSANYIFEHYGLPPITGEWYSENIDTKNFMESIYYSHGVPKGNFEEDLAKLNQLRKEYFELNKNSVSLNSNASETLELLKNLDCELSIISGEMAGYLENGRVAQFGIHKFFKSIRGGVRNKEMAFREFLLENKANPENVYYVDDQADGIEAAKAAEIKSIGFIYDGAYHSIEKIYRAEPTHLIRSLSEIPDIILLERWKR